MVFWKDRKEAVSPNTKSPLFQRHSFNVCVSTNSLKDTNNILWGGFDPRYPYKPRHLLASPTRAHLDPRPVHGPLKENDPSQYRTIRLTTRCFTITITNLGRTKKLAYKFRCVTIFVRHKSLWSQKS